MGIFYLKSVKPKTPLCMCMLMSCIFISGLFMKSISLWNLVKQLEISSKTPFPHKESQKAREGLCLWVIIWFPTMFTPIFVGNTGPNFHFGTLTRGKFPLWKYICLYICLCQGDGGGGHIPWKLELFVQ